MQGVILSVGSAQSLILGDDGARYTFTPLGWQNQDVTPAVGMRVDFEVRGSHAVGIYPIPGAAPTTAAPPPYVPPTQPAAASPAPSSPPPYSVPQTKKRFEMEAWHGMVAGGAALAILVLATVFILGILPASFTQGEPDEPEGQLSPVPQITVQDYQTPVLPATAQPSGGSNASVEKLVVFPTPEATVPVVVPTPSVARSPVPVQPPFRLDWQTSDSEVQAGQSLTLTVRMYDIRQAGEHGGISVSFPSLTAPSGSKEFHSSSDAEVDALDYTTGLSNVTFYQPGETIYHRDNNRQFPAEYLLVESDDPTWSRSDDRTLRLRITPRRGGEFPIQIRGWICAYEYSDCSRQPESGAVEDQQGYVVIRTGPEVAPPLNYFDEDGTGNSFDAASVLARFSTSDPVEGEARAGATGRIIALYRSGDADINRVLDLLHIMAPELSIEERRRAWDRLERLSEDGEWDASEAASAVFYLGSIITGDEPNPEERIEAAHEMVALYQAGELDPDSALDLMNTIAPDLYINERRQAAATLAKLSTDDDWDDSDKMEAASEVFRLVTGVPLNAEERVGAAVDLAAIGVRIFDAGSQFNDRDVDAAAEIIRQSLTGELTAESLQSILASNN